MNNTPCKPSVPKGRPPANKGEDKRKCILDNALTLFAEQGVSGTTVAQIAHASGVTSAMVHYYFHNREGLLDALVAEVLAPRILYIWAWLAEDTPTEPRQIVINIVTRLLEVVDALPQLPQLWNREIFHANGCLRERFIQYIPMDKFEKVLNVLTEAQQKGVMHPQISPDLVVLSAISLVMLPLAIQKYISGLPGLPILEKERIGKHVLALMLEGLYQRKEK